MKIHRVVQMLGATTSTGKLADDMYNLGHKDYYSKAEDRYIPISHMDFQHMVRAFAKLCEQEEMLDRSEHMGRTKDLVAKIERLQGQVETSSAKVKDQDRGRVMRIKELKEDLKKTDDIIENNDKIYKKNLQEQEDRLLGLTTKVENLQGMLKERDELLEQAENLAHRESKHVEYWRKLYYDNANTKGHRYVFSEIPNDEYGKKLTRGMKVYLNNESYTMRVRGQHIKPELKGTGATYWGQSIDQSTHLRVYIDAI